MIVRSRAPLRLGLAGGGTDVSPYSDRFGGAVLNTTINMYAHCTLEEAPAGRLAFTARDIGVEWEGEADDLSGMPDALRLHRAVHERVVRDFRDGEPLSIRATTFADVPPGTGLGSSSTVVVAMLKAYQELLYLPLGEYDLAHLAYEIERIDCALAGGKQDQYAATFGGTNFIEFYGDDRVVVNPLRIREDTLSELEVSLVLFYTGQSRSSARIIEDQATSAHEGEASDALEALHELKASAFRMKEILLKSQVRAMSDVLQESWEAKKRTSTAMSNTFVEEIYLEALQAGARSAKLSGAGGGGVMMIFVDPTRRLDVETALERAVPEGRVLRCHLSENGAESWRVPGPG